MTFKNSYAVEKYVLINLNRHERSILSQFRCGILPLRIETGRYIGEKPEERVCKICKNGRTEDEVHFLFNCEQYRNLRNDLLSVLAQQRDSFLLLSDQEKLKILMNDYPRQLAKYLSKAFDKRKQYLYVNN